MRTGEQHPVAAAPVAGKRHQRPPRALDIAVAAVEAHGAAVLRGHDDRHAKGAGSAAERARIRAIAQAIACDIHPINNLRVLQYLRRELGVSEEQKTAWYRHWITLGLGAVEAMLANEPRTGRFCHGDTPTLADCCLLPQVFNARRFDCDLTAMPTVRRIAENCEALDAFRRAAPACQPDAE